MLRDAVRESWWRKYLLEPNDWLWTRDILCPILFSKLWLCNTETFLSELTFEYWYRGTDPGWRKNQRGIADDVLVLGHQFPISGTSISRGRLQSGAGTICVICTTCATMCNLHFFSMFFLFEFVWFLSDASWWCGLDGRGGQMATEASCLVALSAEKMQTGLLEVGFLWFL